MTELNIGWYSHKQERANRKLFIYTRPDNTEVYVTCVRSMDNEPPPFDDAIRVGPVVDIVRVIQRNIWPSTVPPSRRLQ